MLVRSLPDAAFEKEYGTPMPTGVTWDASLGQDAAVPLRFEFALLPAADFLRSRGEACGLGRFQLSRLSAVLLVSGRETSQHARNGDFVTAEGLPWVFGNYNPSLLSLFMAAAREGGPVQGVTSRSVYTTITISPSVRRRT